MEGDMSKLTDAQLVILANAAKRTDGAILPISKRLKLDQAASIRLLGGLLKKKLVVEAAAENRIPAWRQDKEGRPISLSITESGLQAINIEARDDGSRTTDHAAQARPGRTKRQKAKKQTKERSAGKKKPRSAESPQPRTNTKQATVTKMLQRSGGATLDELAEATGWQPHSVRGVMSGTLKKKLKLKITNEKVEGRGRVYRIAGRG
jgi:predicted ArsR family transcriptional regulator